jgi:hypothetical protein
VHDGAAFLGSETDEVFHGDYDGLRDFRSARSYFTQSMFVKHCLKRFTSCVLFQMLRLLQNQMPRASAGGIMPMWLNPTRKANGELGRASMQG